jgi:signal transduction histidine kinase
MIRGDPYQISRVFDGFISNSIKFSPKGGEVNIQLESIAVGAAHISIQDQGIGITKKDQSQIFNYFFHAKRDKKINTTVSGICLGLVQEIITSHGGQVGVESSPEVGSIFHFMLPLAK